MNKNVTETMLEAAAQRFRILGEPMRLRILEVLENRELTVTAIADTLKSSEANISRHVQALSQAGLISRRREGLDLIYSVSDPFALKICELVFSNGDKATGMGS